MAVRGAYGKNRGDRRSRSRTDSWPERNPVTALSLILALGFLFGTPQVRLILFDFPSIDAIGLKPAGRAVASLWLYTLLLFGAYFAIAWSLFDSRTVEEEAADTVREGILGLPHRWVRRLQRITVPFMRFLLVAPAQRRTKLSRRSFGVLLIILGLLPGLLSSGQLEARTGYSLRMLWPRLLGTGMLLTGVWLLLARLPTDEGRPALPRERAIWDHRVQFSLLWGRCVELTIVGSVAGELIWLLVTDGYQSLSWRVYTLWGSCQIALYILIFGRLADAFGRRTWTRILTGAAMLVALGAVSSGVARIGVDRRQPVGDGSSNWSVFNDDWRTYDADVERQITGDLTDEWFDAVNDRLDRMGKDDTLPVLFVAASGGGSRAALWSTWVLEALERIHIEDDRPALPGSGEAKKATLADTVLFLSSVSGGSLGGVNWALGRDWYYKDLARPKVRKELVNTDKRELESGYRAMRDQLCDRGGQLPDWAFRCSSGNSSFDPLDWPAASARADLMATDFNAPTLRGMVLPSMGRGQSLQDFWDSTFEWAGPDNYKKAPGDTPLLLINSTEVHTGFRLVAGWPQLPPGLLWDSGDRTKMRRRLPVAEKAGEEPGETEAEYRARVYWSNLGEPFGPRVRSITDIDPYLKVSPAEAVRMSANFPWGFDIPQLNTSLDDPRRSALEERVLVIDGGVLDNTGIDTLAALMERLDFHASGEAGETPFQDQANRLLDRLSRRGVVLVEIDSGSKPAAPGLAERTLRNTLMPVSALDEAAYVREREARLNHVATIRNVLERHGGTSLATQLVTGGDTDFVATIEEETKEELNRRKADPDDILGQVMQMTSMLFARSVLGPLLVKRVEEAERAQVEQQVARRLKEEAYLAGEIIGDRVGHITFTANRGENIMTAWALAPEQKGELLYRFVFEHAIEAPELQEAWRFLRGENRLLKSLEEMDTEHEHYRAMLTLIAQLSQDQEDEAAAEDRDATRMEEERARFWNDFEDVDFDPKDHEAKAEGWIFLGFGAEHAVEGSKPRFRWETVHLEIDQDEDPTNLRPSKPVELGQRSVVRAEMPNVLGEMSPSIDVVPKGARVKVQEVRKWVDDEHLWFAWIGDRKPPPAPVEELDPQELLDVAPGPEPGHEAHD